MGIDFLDKAKAIIVPHANTLFFPDNGHAHAIPMRGELGKEKVIATSIHRE